MSNQYIIKLFSILVKCCAWKSSTWPVQLKGQILTQGITAETSGKEKKEKSVIRASGQFLFSKHKIGCSHISKIIHYSFLHFKEKWDHLYTEPEYFTLEKLFSLSPERKLHIPFVHHLKHFQSRRHCGKHWARRRAGRVGAGLGPGRASQLHSLSPAWPWTWPFCFSVQWRE